MKFVADPPFADPETAARKLLELANSVDPVQDGRTTTGTLTVRPGSGPRVICRRGGSPWPAQCLGQHPSAGVA